MAIPIDSKIGVLLLSSFDEDLIALLRMLGRPGWSIYWYTSWADAAGSIEPDSIRVVICDRELPDTSWRHILRRLNSFRNPPALIVTAPEADERLWAEVLNLGGYDVLVKPFDAYEVARTVRLAARAWTTAPAA